MTTSRLHCLIAELIGTSVRTPFKSHNKLRNSTQWPIFVQPSHFTYSQHAEIYTLLSYERHFKYRLRGRTVLLQLGCGIVNGIIILWYMAVFIFQCVIPCITTSRQHCYTSIIFCGIKQCLRCVISDTLKALKYIQALRGCTLANAI